MWIVSFWMLWVWQGEIQPSQGFEIFPLTGQVEARQEMRLSTQTPGEVEKIAVVPGQVCQKDDVILILRDAGQKEQIEAAKHGLEAAQGAEQLARRQVDRLSRLHETGAVSTVQFEQAKLAHQNALAQVNQAAAGLKAQKEALRYLEIRAPFSGQVSEVYVALGARVGPGQPLARLIGPDARTIRVSVPGRMDAALADARFEVKTPSGWQSAQRTNASASYESNGNLLVYLNEVSDLAPYQRVEVRILVPKKGLFLAPGSWETRGAATFVWVETEQGAVRRLVKLGPSLPDGRREVLAGLIAGERWVQTGGQP